MSDYINNNCAFSTVKLALKGTKYALDNNAEDKFWAAAAIFGYQRYEPMPEDVFMIFCEQNPKIAIIVIEEAVQWIADKVTYALNGGRLYDYCKEGRPEYFICIKRQNTEPAHWAPCTDYPRQTLARLCFYKENIGVNILTTEKILSIDAIRKQQPQRQQPQPLPQRQQPQPPSRPAEPLVYHKTHWEGKYEDDEEALEEAIKLSEQHQQPQLQHPQPQSPCPYCDVVHNEPCEIAGMF